MIQQILKMFGGQAAQDPEEAPELEADFVYPEKEKIKPPKGFEEKDARKALAETICQMIDEYDSGMSSSEKPKHWADVEAVYDDEKVVSSLKFLDSDDIEPYNLALMQTRADSLVDHICGTITGPDPKFVFKSAEVEDSDREAVEHDVDFLLDCAKFGIKVRGACLQSVLKTRGPLRVRFVSVDRDCLHDYEDVKNLGIGEKQFVGIAIDQIKPESAIFYPLYSGDIAACSLVGHKTIMRLGDIRDMQADGVYFDDVNIDPGDESNGMGSSREDEAGKEIADVEVRYRLPAEDGSESKNKTLRYRAVVHLKSRELLALEEYRLPRSSYFAPGLRNADSEEFWGKKSIAHKMLETQTIANDSITLAIAGTAAEAFTSVIESGGLGDQQTTRIGINQLLHRQAATSYTPIPRRFQHGAIPLLIDLSQKIADSIAKISQAGMGAEFQSGTTATAAAGYLAGQAKGLGSLVEQFGDELVAMADFVRYLMAIKFDELKAFHGRQLQTREASLFIAKFEIDLNGKAGSDPVMVVQKLQMLVETAIKMNVPIDAPAVFEAIMNALELPISTSKFLPEGGLDNVAPEQLLGMLEQLRAQMAPGQMGGGMPPGVGAMPAIGPGNQGV